jgi:hypothetical protein
MLMKSGKKLTNCLLLSGLSMIAACGGSGGGSSDKQAAVQVTPPPVFLPTTTVSGVFDGTLTDNGRAVTLLTQADGSFYLVYSGSNNLPAGAVVGTGSVSNGSFTSVNAKDLSLVGTGTQTAANATVSASVVKDSSFNGTVTYTPPKAATAFSTRFNSSFTKLPAMADLAGTYIGAIATPGVKEDQIKLTITSSGSLSGELSCGCKVSASLTTSGGNSAYVISLSFVGGDHVLSNKSMAGNVYFDAVRKRIYIIGNVAGTDSAIYVGAKQ